MHKLCIMMHMVAICVHGLGAVDARYLEEWCNRLEN